MKQDKEYYRRGLFKNLKIILISLLVGTAFVVAVTVYAYKDKTIDQSIISFILGLVMLSLIVSFVVCSIINVFVPNIGIVDSIMNNIINACKNIIAGVFNGAICLSVSSFDTPMMIIPVLLCLIRIMIGIVVGAVAVGIMAVTALVVNIIFWIQTLYFLTRLIICTVNGNKVIQAESV